MRIVIIEEQTDKTIIDTNLSSKKMINFIIERACSMKTTIVYDNKQPVIVMRIDYE